MWMLPGNELYVMGSNADGQLGIGSVSGSNVPIPVGSGIWPSGTVTLVAAGLQHTAVVAGVQAHCAVQCSAMGGGCFSSTVGSGWPGFASGAAMHALACRMAHVQTASCTPWD